MSGHEFSTGDDKVKALGGSLAAVAVGIIVALAGGDGGARLGGVPVFVWCAVVAFAINWVVFVPSYLVRTEHYYDLTGTITYLLTIWFAVLATDNVDWRGILAAVLVSTWTLRLGVFLFARVKKAGGDGRFDEVKQEPLRFLMYWSIQGLWVLFTAAAALAAITSADGRSFGVLAAVGLILWIVGFAIEVIADRQKSAFKADPANDGRFITTGLWSWSRHPNYFGEIVLWIGMAVLALPVLSGWQFVTLISPVFVYVLLTRMSGIPLLESRAKKRWGDEPEFQAYKAATPVLFPRPPSRPQ